MIEHVDRPDTFLQEIAALMRPGGLLFISTPDIGSLVARVAGKHWHYYNRYHLSLLSSATIRRIAEACHLRAVGFQRLPRLKSVGFALQYLADFVIGTGRIRVPARLNRIVVPVNLHDSMCVAFEKDS